MRYTPWGFSVFGYRFSVYRCSARLCLRNNTTVVIWLYGSTMICRYKVLYRISLQMCTGCEWTTERLYRRSRSLYTAAESHVTPREPRSTRDAHRTAVAQSRRSATLRRVAGPRESRCWDAARTFTSPYTWRMLQDGCGVLAARVCCNYYYCILSFWHYINRHPPMFTSLTCAITTRCMRLDDDDDEWQCPRFKTIYILLSYIIQCVMWYCGKSWNSVPTYLSSRGYSWCIEWRFCAIHYL